ncbi:hypothetical protein CSC17_0536 [Klebsiella oxytoca]|nr:hypothetical protein CSC17_0536 [Klebsiella oxytoca]
MCFLIKYFVNYMNYMFIFCVSFSLRQKGHFSAILSIIVDSYLHASK